MKMRADITDAGITLSSEVKMGEPIQKAGNGIDNLSASPDHQCHERQKW